MRTLSAAQRRIERFIDLVGQLTLWLTLAMVLLVATNVLLRYAFSLGSVWAQELEWHLLAAVILLGMSYALQRGEAVRVDVFYGSFSPGAKFVVNLFSLLLTLVLAGLFIKLSWAYVMQSYAIGETSADPGGIPYRWAVKGLIPLGFALLFVQTLGALAKLLIAEQLRRGGSAKAVHV
ncbi:C4-dicarboxylate ABC transporter permease [beta proteobacterium AAP121]|nr:C4-dicarboxylate ABC transporter permease [beta proteobacterium AAP65]KPG01077.1 C4-dicarboxylate ABC transporter permease [beta proteobacterium AAP121]